MAITGVHNLFYSPEPEALRAVLADGFGWRSVDVGDGWLIFAMPPGEIAVHPADSPGHEITFFCDDLAATMDDLAERGVEFRGPPEDQGWGIVVTMLLPGGVEELKSHAVFGLNELRSSIDRRGRRRANCSICV